MNLAISSLNSMFFGVRKPGKNVWVDDLHSLPLAQREVILKLIKEISALGPPPLHASRTGALQALRATCSSYMEPEPGVGSVVNMALESLSLPSGKVASVSLVDHIDESLKPMVQNFEEFMLRDADSFSELEVQAENAPPPLQ